LFLAACGQPQSAGYPPQYEYNFMQACRAGGSDDALCGCIWRKIVAEIPVRDFEAFERLPAAERPTHPMMTQVRTYQTACAAGQ
jgi:hypothetical protein